MKLHDLSQKRTSAQVCEAYQAQFGKPLAIKAMGRAALDFSKAKIASLIAEQKAKPSFHRSEQDPEYLRLLMIAEAINARLAEAVTTGTTGTSGTTTAGAIAAGPAAKPNAMDLRTKANNMKDPKMKAIMNKAATGQSLTPDETKALASIAPDTMANEDAGSAAEYSIKYYPEDDVWCVVDSVGNRVETFIDKAEALRELRKYRKGPVKPRVQIHRGVNYRGDMGESKINEEQSVYKVKHNKEDDVYDVVDELGNVVSSHGEKPEAFGAIRKLKATTGPKRKVTGSYGKKEVDEAVRVMGSDEAGVGMSRHAKGNPGAAGQRNKVAALTKKARAQGKYMGRDSVTHVGNDGARVMKYNSKDVKPYGEGRALSNASLKQLVEFYRKHRTSGHNSVRMVEAEILRRKAVMESDDSKKVTVKIKKVHSGEANVSKRHVTYDAYVNGEYEKSFDDINDAMDYKEAKEKVNESPIKKGRRMVSEAEVQQAQVVLAAQDLVDQVQKMIENAVTTQFKDLPALVGQIRLESGPDQSTSFNQAATAALSALIQSLQGAKDQLQGAVDMVTGNAPAGPDINAGDDLGADLPPAGDDDAAASDLGLDDELDLGDETSDITGLGRERR